MKSALPLKIAALATAAISIVIPIDPGRAQTLFDETEVPQQNFVTVASPFGENNQRYTLIVMEQIPGRRSCWGEIGSQPTVIDPCSSLHPTQQRPPHRNSPSVRTARQKSAMRVKMVSRSRSV